MKERTWTATSTWTMVFKPDFRDTANFFGKDIEVVDLEMNPHEYKEEVRWAITLTYLRKDAEKFGELLQKFDILTGHETTKTIKVANAVEDEGADYENLPF